MKVLVCGGVKTSKIVHSMMDRFRQAGIEFIGANNITTIIDLLNRGDYYDRAVFFEKGITDDGNITDEHIIRNRLYDFMETVIPKAQADSSYVFVVDKENIAKMISDETMSISYQSKIFVKSGSLAMKYLAMIMASPLSEMDNTYEFDLARYNESMRSSESVEYSDVTYSDGEQLSSISNYEFDGVVVDGDGSAEESSDVSYIGDFDDIDELEDRRLGDYGKSVKFNRVESSNAEEEDRSIRHKGFIGKVFRGKQKREGIQDKGLEIEGDSGDAEYSEHGNEKYNNSSNIGFNEDEEYSGEDEDFNYAEDGEYSSEDEDFDNIEDEEYSGEDTDFGSTEDEEYSSEDKDFTYAEDEEYSSEDTDFDNIEDGKEHDKLDGDDFVDIADGVDFIGIEDGDFGYEEDSKRGDSELVNIDDGDSADLDYTDEEESNNSDNDSLDDIEQDGDDFDDTEDRDIELVDRLFTSGESLQVLDDEDDKYSYSGVENEVGITDLWGESANTSDGDGDTTDVDETDLWQEDKSKSGLFSDDSMANKVTPSIGLSQAISQSQDDNKCVDVIGQHNSVDNTGSKLGDKGKQKKGILGGLRGLTARAKSGNKVSKGTDDIAMDARLESILNTYKSRGCSMVVTGTSCSGKSVIAYNLANLLRELGYSVLIVDMDTIGRAQAYISKYSYDCMHSMDAENSSLKQALNAINHGAGEYVNIIKPNLHLLSLGLAGDIVTGDKLAPKTRIARFCSNIRNNYNFIIYDMPFKSAIDYASDVTFTADNILFTCECNTHGFMNMMLDMCNIDSEDMQETMFCRSQLCFTKYKDFNNVFGDKVKGAKEALTRIDLEVQGLLGIEPEYYFSNLSVCGIIPYDESYDSYWLKEKQITDTPSGKSDYLHLLGNVLIKK